MLQPKNCETINAAVDGITKNSDCQVRPHIALEQRFHQRKVKKNLNLIRFISDNKFDSSAQIVHLIGTFVAMTMKMKQDAKKTNKNQKKCEKKIT